MENSTTSYKLYGIPYLGSMAIELLMEEAGIKYDIVFPTPEERNSEEFKKISPRGLVPVLITPDGQSIFEGPAIINFLLETHHTNLIAPIGNPDRTTCFQWLSFLSTALGNANNRFFFPDRYGSTETVIKEKDFGSTLARLNVSEGPFLMVPFIGPKTTRDFTGTILDRQNMATLSSNSIDDLNLAEIPINIIDKRGKMSKTIDNIYLSADPYIKIRSFYLQNRRNEIYSKKYIENKNNNLDAEFEKLLD